MTNAPLKFSTVALVISSVLAYPAFAGPAEDSKPPATSSPALSGAQNSKDLRQFSQAGHSAMIDIGDARLAIFNGDTKVAMKMMDSAKAAILQAGKDAPAFAGSTAVNQAKSDTVKANSPKMQVVPVDGQLALADDFVMTPEKKVHVDKANASFKKGDHKAGLEELRLGEIDVNYTRWWLPIEATEAHLDQAIKLANESKYYEANLALKAIEDSVTVDSISFSDLPASSSAKSPS